MAEPTHYNMPPMNHAQKAINLVYGDRHDKYGHPEDVYEKVAGLWSGYLGMELSSEDCAIMMVLLKIGREMNRHNPDNLVDAHGFLLVLERIQNRKKGLE